MGHDDYVFIEYIFNFCFIDFARRRAADKIDYYKIDYYKIDTLIYILIYII